MEQSIQIRPMEFNSQFRSDILLWLFFELHFDLFLGFPFYLGECLDNMIG